MTDKSEGYFRRKTSLRNRPPSDSVASITSSDSGYEWLSCTPLQDEEAIERRRRRRDEQGAERNAPKKQELVSAFPVDESRNYTIPAALLARYPALAGLNWSHVSDADDVDDGYNGEPSEPSSFDDSGKDYSDFVACYTAPKPSSKEKILEELAATSQSKETGADTVFEYDRAAKISEELEPLGCICGTIEPLTIPEVKEDF